MKKSASIVLAFLLTVIHPAWAGDEAAIQRGKYLYDGADCAGCHGADPSSSTPSGGKSLTTPFGIFHAPNITPDKQFGIGTWSVEDFHHALRQGIAPGGKQLFPVFPFPSFSALTDRDMEDLYAYLMSIPPVAVPSKPHEVQAPFSWRSLMWFWRALFLKPGPYQPQAGRDAEWNRGNYLVHAVAHCQECHTPRNPMGALIQSRAFSGNIGGPDGQNAPNITSDVLTGIGGWTVDEIETLLKTGQTPAFDAVGSGMKAVVRGTSKLTDADRHAMAVYLKTVPAIRTPLPPKPVAASK
ncbi:MAG: c-type cytochrome [Alphaproteobacteria bacterium]|nr:c-type cytochrome [Alphaproteobacteria bacterium]